MKEVITEVVSYAEVSHNILEITNNCLLWKAVSSDVFWINPIERDVKEN